MAKAEIIKQLTVITENKVGILQEVSLAISAAGANISAICAYAMQDKAHFYLITSDNRKAASALKAKDYAISEQEVVLIQLEDKPGQAAQMAGKIKAAGININYIYGTTCKCTNSNTCMIIIDSHDNKKLVSVVNKNK
ncbi:MAG: hypothetical protein ABH952_01560 [Candidatus Omnitrophota bacterium]